jgi:hypothetical protein
MAQIRVTLLAASAALLAACGPSKEHVAQDSTQALAATKEHSLATQLAAQKDSLTRIVLQADEFISHVDSSLTTAKGISHKGASADLDPIARSVENRKLIMDRVDALVKRARATSNELAKQNKHNATLLAQLKADSVMITELNNTLKRQEAEITTLASRVDSLRTESTQLASNLASTKTTLATTSDSLLSVQLQHNRAYVVIGNEDELVKKGVAVREGGANLLIMHPGRTLQIARNPDPTAFNAVDQRQINEITVPDTTKRYRIISRQSLDYTTVADRNRDTFKGNLKIADPLKFWSASRYLVLVEM